MAQRDGSGIKEDRLPADTCETFPFASSCSFTETIRSVLENFLSSPRVVRTGANQRGFNPEYGARANTHLRPAGVHKPAVKFETVRKRERIA